MELEEMLAKQGIRDTLEYNGFDFEKIFCSMTAEASELYCRYKWQKIDCSVPGIKNGNVVHAFPSTEIIEDAPWEEWFFLDEKAHHHVLFIKNRDCCKSYVDIPSNDVDHPAPARGKRWYYYEDDDIRPFAAR